MKVEVSKLSGAALDWAVATAEGFTADQVIEWNEFDQPCYSGPLYSESWALGGPIIEREEFSIIRCDDEYGTDKKGFTTSQRIPVWAACVGQRDHEEVYGSQGDMWGSVYSIGANEVIYGPTPLIAAMRCYVLDKLGHMVEIPEELSYVDYQLMLEPNNLRNRWRKLNPKTQYEVRKAVETL